MMVIAIKRMQVGMVMLDQKDLAAVREKVRKNLEELNQHYRITKLENDNTAMLLKMIDDLSRRIGELEKRTA